MHIENFKARKTGVVKCTAFPMDFAGLGASTALQSDDAVSDMGRYMRWQKDGSV